MKFDVECPGCRATFPVAVEHAGKRGHCPRCRAVIRLPAAPGPEPEPEPELELELEPEPKVEAASPPRVDAWAAGSRRSTPRPAPRKVDWGDDDDGGAYDLVGAPTAGASARKMIAKTAALTPTAEGAKAVDAGPTRPTRTPKQILAAFRGQIEPVEPSASYRTWIVVISLVMLLLPAIYLALIALIGYLMYLHAITNHTWLTAVTGRAVQFALAAYLGPIVAGFMVIGFLLKPMFARPSKRSKVRQIDPSREPLIAAFVDGVCASVGAPSPSRIEVDCDVNASARLASWVLAPNRELVLTIGLPLVGGLTLREFTGVLAHEFGHFSQGAGMRLSGLIRSINIWFLRVVYERDEWDDSLARWSHGGHISIILVAWIIRAAVWLSRRVLWLLMHFGFAVSGFLSRQMEFDADRYEARMVGGPTFERTCRRLRELGLGWQVAQTSLEASWRDRRLPDDLTRLVLVEASKLPEPARAMLRQMLEEAKTGPFDTHPADRDRIVRAHAEAPDGIFDLDGPATDLFRDFDGLSREVTFDYYRSLLGGEVDRSQLFPVEHAVLDREVRREGQESFERFFLGALGPIQAIPLPEEYPATPSDPKAAKVALVAARKAMRLNFESNKEALVRWGERHDSAAKARAATHLLKAGKGISAGKYGLKRAKLPEAEAAVDDAIERLESVERDLSRFGKAAAKRLATALAILEYDSVAARVPGGDARREEARALYPCGRALGAQIVPEMAKLLRAMQAMALVLDAFQANSNKQDQAMINAVLRAAKGLHEALTELRWRIGDAIPYPFEHGHDLVTLGRYALPRVPGDQEIGEMLQAGAEVQDRIFSLHHRLFGRLAATAEAVEKAIGLPPLEVPKPEDVEDEEG